MNMNGILRIAIGVMVSVIAFCASATGTDLELTLAGKGSALEGPRNFGPNSSTHKTKLSRDRDGRISRIENSVGDFLDFHYGSHGRLILVKTRVGFIPISRSDANSNSRNKLSREGSAELRVGSADLLQIPGVAQIRNEALPSKFGGEEIARARVNDCLDGGTWCDPFILKPHGSFGVNDCLDGGTWCDSDNFQQQCMADPACFGAFDGFMNAITEYFANGGAALAAFGGAVYGLTLEALTAGLGTLANIGVFADIVTVYGFAGIGVGVVFIGGYAVGTFINDGFNNIVWRSW